MTYVAGNGEAGMADRVLIVEDDPVVADLLRSVLERAGYEVIVFGDGVEALEWAFHERPDAIVLDVALPTIDGFEVLRRIRRDHRTMFAVVVLLTGMSGAAERAYGWDLEPDDYLVKPFDPDDLVARLGGRLRRVRQALATSWAMLPSGTMIEAHARQLLDDGEGFALLHIDLDEFKAFNGRYGWVRGNQAIALLARIVESVANDVGVGSFAGHVGGDDFSVTTDPDLGVKFALEVIDRFDRAVLELYDPDDRAARRVVVADRRGELASHRIMTVSIGIATTAVRGFTHYGEAFEVAAAMLRIAKRPSRSSFAIDRRRDDPDDPGTLVPVR
jgi:diguanylate cyclase (GGDEF)-like protein